MQGLSRIDGGILFRSYLLRPGYFAPFHFAILEVARSTISAFRGHYNFNHYRRIIDFPDSAFRVDLYYLHYLIRSEAEYTSASGFF